MTTSNSDPREFNNIINLIKNIPRLSTSYEKQTNSLMIKIICTNEMLNKITATYGIDIDIDAKPQDLVLYSTSRVVSHHAYRTIPEQIVKNKYFDVVFNAIKQINPDFTEENLVGKYYLNGQLQFNTLVVDSVISQHMKGVPVYSDKIVELKIHIVTKNISDNVVATVLGIIYDIDDDNALLLRQKKTDWSVIDDGYNNKTTTKIPDWFNVDYEPIIIKDRHLINVPRTLGIKATMKSTYRSHDIQGGINNPTSVASPWNQPTMEMGDDVDHCFNTHT